MPIDYSRWDGLELSDDDDFECHPNVDKASMIRWKQADIHRRRRADKDNIAALKRELNLISWAIRDLDERLKNQREKGENFADSPPGYIQNVYVSMVKNADETYYKEMSVDRDHRWGPPAKDEFVMERIDIGAEIAKAFETSTSDDGVDPVKIEKKVMELIHALNGRSEDINKYIKSKEEEAARKITFDDLTTGFSKTIITKRPPEEQVDQDIRGMKGLYDSKEGDKSADGDSAMLPYSEGIPDCIDSEEMFLEEDAEYISDDKAKTFSQLKDIEDCKRFLMDNPRIINNACSDMILVEAFKLKMIGKTEESNLCVRQSSIIRYILALGSVDLSKAIDALTNVKRQTSNYFYSDVARMCEIVTERIGAIKARAKHQKEMILEYADSIRRPDGTYPPPKREGIDDNVSEEERERAFAKIPSDVQRALITRDTQKINEYLASLSFEEGKSVLDEWSAAGLITIAIDSLEHGGKSQKKADPADNPQ